MPAGGESRRSRWEWSIVLVVSLHLLSTAGGWWITDHGEILAVADNILTSGRFDLGGLRPGWENWSKIVDTRGTTATRFAPLSIVVLVPFLAVDRVVGWTRPEDFHVVHLQGHVFIALGLILLGRHAARRGASPAAVALTIAVIGLSWPVWMIARRIGPEPLLFFLFALLAVGQPRVRLLVLFLLPWTHATGPVLGLTTLIGGIRNFEYARSIGAEFAAWAAGVFTFALFWNYGVHGHALLGGYARYATDASMRPQTELLGLALNLVVAIPWTLPIWLRCVGLPTAMWTRIVASVGLPLALGSLTANPVPVRRIAPTLALVGGALGSLPVPSRGLALVAGLGALVSGLVGLAGDFVDVVPTPFGIFSGPKLFWLHLLAADHPSRLAWPAFLALCGVAVIAARNVLGLYRRQVTAVSNSSDERPTP